jgi:hypothetical protein
MFQWLYTYVASVYSKYFLCFRRMLQMFYSDVAYVAVAIQICCKRMLQTFHLFHTNVAEVLHVATLADAGSGHIRRRSRWAQRFPVRDKRSGRGWSLAACALAGTRGTTVCIGALACGSGCASAAIACGGGCAGVPVAWDGCAGATFACGGGRSCRTGLAACVASGTCTTGGAGAPFTNSQFGAPLKMQVLLCLQLYRLARVEIWSEHKLLASVGLDSLSGFGLCCNDSQEPWSYLSLEWPYICVWWISI